MVLIFTIGLCAMGFFIWMGVGGLLASGFRFENIWASESFRRVTYFNAGLLVLLTLLGSWLVRAGGKAKLRRGRALDGQDGTAILEFALVLPIALGIVLLMIQASLLMGGFLCVNYASYCAARAAVVFVPDVMPNEPANEVEDYFDPDASEKLSRIHMAAVWAVMPVSDGRYSMTSNYTDVLIEGLRDIYSQAGEEVPRWASWENVYLARKLAYAQENTSVELRPPLNGIEYADHEDLRVLARHNLYLAVPYAARILAALDADEAVDFGEGRYALRVEIPCTLRNEGIDDRIELNPNMDDIEPRW